MGGSSDKTTTVQKADPWKGAQPYLKQALGEAQTLFNRGQLSPAPYQGNRVAPYNWHQQQGHELIRDTAAGQQPFLQGAQEGLSGFMDGSQAQSTLSNMMSPGYQSQQLDAVKNNALGSAIPAAVSQFAGSGMANSSSAMDTVGRAATEAVSPYEYDAFNQSQNRALSAADTMGTNALRAAGLAPGMAAAGYLPGQMYGEIGNQLQGQGQAEMDAAMQKYYETANQGRDELGAFSDMILGYGGLGSTKTASGTEPGMGMAQKIGTAGLGGLGTYGAFAMNPATAPFAMMGGLGAGLLGLF